MKRLFAACLALTLGAFCTVAFGQMNPVPRPTDVPGKVISDGFLTGDLQSNGFYNAHMTREWDGLGDTTDTFDYTNSLGAVLPPGGVPPDVDALANIGDLFFPQLVADRATLLVSPAVQQDAFPGLFEIYSRTATPFGSLAAPWAKNAPSAGLQGIGGAPPPNDNIPPENIDALEVWGGSDHNIFSLYRDPPDVTGRDVSLFLYDVANDSSSAYLYNDDLRTALNLGPLDPAIDLDGAMVYEDRTNPDFVFGPGDSLLFSVEMNGQFDGGEIWVWNHGSPAQFLQHGGVTWDTLNPVAQLFGWTANNPADIPRLDDIDALEAIFFVPEPSSFALALVGMLILGRSRRQR